MPGTKLQEHTGSDKAWVWSTMDFASEVQRMELFCLKLPSPASRVAVQSLMLMCGSALLLWLFRISGMQLCVASNLHALPLASEGVTQPETVH